MRQEEIILYKSALAYYKISPFEGKHLVAELQQYDGSQEQMPPRKVVYLSGDDFYRSSLVEDVCKALGKSIQ